MTAATIVQALGGRWHGSYGMALCVCHDDGTSPALKISDDTRKSDGIDVVCFAGCNWRHVKAELVKRGLLGGYVHESNADATPVSHCVHDHISKHASNYAHARNADLTPVSNASVKHASHPNRAAAAAMWAAALPAEGTPVENYLRSRGITIIPPTLRAVPDAKHGPTGLTFPCMLAAVTVWPSKTVHAVHRTFLTADGREKARVSEPRMMLGPCAGGAVRLAPVADEIAVAEGIETALAAMQATGIPTWAALSTSGVQTVVLPREARSIVILADNDAPGEQAARALAARLGGEGRKVRIAYPPPGFKDFNDTLLAGAA